MGSNASLLDRAKQLESTLVSTPIRRLEHEHVNLFAKLEFCNVVGSIKDKPAFWILKSAIERGEITEQTTVLESSSGNFANALSQFCRALGLKFIPVIDPNISGANEAMLRRSCDTVVKVHEPDDSQGYLKTRFRVVQELQTTLPETYWTNQYANRDAIEAHERFIGTEICEAFSQLDYVFVGVSTAGTISGISNCVRARFPHAQIVAVDAEGSVIFGGPPGKRYIPGIGATLVPAFLKGAAIDQVVVVPELDTVAGCRELLSRHGLFAGGSSGSSYSAVQQVFSTPAHGRKPNVLFLCCDRGAAYIDTVYNDAWVAERLGGGELRSVQGLSAGAVPPRRSSL